MFMLHYNGAFFDAVPVNHVTEPQGHQIATAQLAVNGKIEQGQVTWLAVQLEPDKDSPDLPGLQWWLLAEQSCLGAGFRGMRLIW